MDKKTTYIIFVVLFCIGLFCAWDLFSGRTDNNIQERIDTIADDNQRAGAAIDDAAGKLDNIGAGIDNAAEITNRIEKRNSDSKTIIGRCIELNHEAKSILDGIEQRNQSGTQESKS